MAVKVVAPRTGYSPPIKPPRPSVPPASAAYRRALGPTYAAAMPALGRAIGDVLLHFGGHRAYAIGGDYAAGLLSHLSRRLDVQPASNEMHAAFAACGQAEAEGFGICATTYTVGSLPCASAAALARTERLPVVFLSGAPGEREVSGGAIHHTVHPSTAWREDYDSALRAFAGLGLRAERLQGARNPQQPNIAGSRFCELVQHAWLHREPVLIEVPRDLLDQPTQPIVLPDLEGLPASADWFAHGDAIVAEVLHRLARARQPLVFVGDQVKLNRELVGLIRAFTARQGLRLATSWFAKGLFDEWDPTCLGSYNGVFSGPRVRRAIEGQTDYVIEVGTSVLAMDTATAFRTATHWLESFSHKTVLRATAAREHDLVQLFRRLAEAPPLRARTVARPRPMRVRPPAPEQPLGFNNLAAVLEAAQAESPTGCVFLPEVGSAYFASYGLRVRCGGLGRGWIANPWYAAMGTALPYARAAAAAIRARGLSERVVVLTGDGGFHFQANELAHFQRERLDATIIFLRNDQFALGRQGDSKVYECMAPDFDVAALMRAYGGRATRCESVGDFMDAFKASLRPGSGIRLIEVPCSCRPADQCREVRLLNLYIRAANKQPRATAQWARLCSGPR